jgi:membrane protein DedA with SNARE-associated domain
MPILSLLHIHLHLRQFHGPPIDYVGLALASGASWFGVPGPGEPVLIAAGVIAAKSKLDITSVLLVAWIGATAGGVLGWLVGLKAGRALVTGPGPFRRVRVNAVARGERVFERYAVIAIVLTPSWVAGINRVRSSLYLPINAAGAALWAVGIGLGAYYIGPTVVDLVDDLGLVTGIVVATLAVAAVAAEVIRRRRRRRRGEPLARQ